MTDSINKITAAASNGLTRAEVIATVLNGRALTADEQTAYDKARGIWKLREAKRKAEKKAAGPMSGADRVWQSTHGRYDVAAIPPVKNAARRRLATASALFFIDRYCTSCRKGFLKSRVPRTMYRIVRAMQLGVTSGTPYHIRMPRGHGKSSYVKGVTMWALATGRSHFVEAVAANSRKAQSILRDIWACMNYSPHFAEDFPEISVFTKKTGGNDRRAPFVTFRGEAVGMKKSADEICLPSADIGGEPTASSGSTLLAVGFSSNVRGEVFGSQRPDLMIFDDLQDREMANNPDRVMEAVNLIRADFMGSDSHTEVSSAFMTSTPIAPEDLSETLAKDPYWRTETYRMMPTMPKAFDPQDDSCPWGKFAALWRHEVLNRRDPHPACNQFYVERRAEMDAGAVVLNPKNFKPNEVSAIEHAMILYYTKGAKAFKAEYQMEPTRDEYAFEITPQIILSRIRADARKLTVPPGFVFTAAATDINPSYALTTAIVTFDPNRSGIVIGHIRERIEIHENGINPTEFIQRVYNAVAAHGRMLSGLGVKINVWGIDAGGKQADAVVPFAARFNAVAMFGRSQNRINLYPRNRVHDPINRTVECADPAKGTRWMFWDSDWYKETSQRSWASEVGAPGGLSLYAGGDHDEFAVQVANERLKRKRALPRGGDICEYDWKTKEPHDYGDCVAMCYALAGANNIAAGGSRLPSVRRGKKVVIR